MKIAVVASSVPSAGKRPAIPQQIGFTTAKQRLALTFINTGLVVFKEKLVIGDEILAVFSLQEDVLRHYADTPSIPHSPSGNSVEFLGCSADATPARKSRILKGFGRAITTS